MESSENVVRKGEAVLMEDAVQPQAPAGALAPRTVELLIGTLLKSGVAVSLTLVLTGVTLSFLHHPDYFRSTEDLPRLLAPENGPRSLEGVLRHAREVRGQAFVMLGLLVMVAVPMLRVLIALVSFRQQRDRAFVRVTSVVLALLALSLLLGRATESVAAPDRGAESHLPTSTPPPRGARH